MRIQTKVAHVLLINWKNFEAWDVTEGLKVCIYTDSKEREIHALATVKAERRFVTQAQSKLFTLYVRIAQVMPKAPGRS